MSFASSIISFIEPILSRKQLVTEFISLGGVDSLLLLLKGNSSLDHHVLIDVTLCSIDPIPNSLGYFPVINAISRCFSHISEHETELFIKLTSSSFLTLSQTLKRQLG